MRAPSAGEHEVEEVAWVGPPRELVCPGSTSRFRASLRTRAVDMGADGRVICKARGPEMRAPILNFFAFVDVRHQRDSQVFFFQSSPYLVGPA